MVKKITGIYSLAIELNFRGPPGSGKTKVYQSIEEVLKAQLEPDYQIIKHFKVVRGTAAETYKIYGNLRHG